MRQWWFKQITTRVFFLFSFFAVLQLLQWEIARHNEFFFSSCTSCLWLFMKNTTRFYEQFLLFYLLLSLKISEIQIEKEKHRALNIYFSNMLVKLMFSMIENVSFSTCLKAFHLQGELWVSTIDNLALLLKQKLWLRRSKVVLVVAVVESFLSPVSANEIHRGPLNHLSAKGKQRKWISKFTSNFNR